MLRWLEARADTEAGQKVQKIVTKAKEIQKEIKTKAKTGA
jgi:hypothetical protein